MFGIAPPFYFVIPLALLSVPLVVLLPPRSSNAYIEPNVNAIQQGLDNHREVPFEREEEEPLLTSTSTNAEDATDRVPRSAHQSPSSTMQMNSEGTRQALRGFWKVIVDHRIVQYACAASLAITLGKQSLHILLQYASKRFGITIAEVSNLLEFACLEFNSVNAN